MTHMTHLTHMTHPSPYRYVLAALDAMANADDALPNAADMDIADIVNHVFTTHGVSYDDM